jgi:hypothetical protein
MVAGLAIVAKIPDREMNQAAENTVFIGGVKGKVEMMDGVG